MISIAKLMAYLSLGLSGVLLSCSPVHVVSTSQEAGVHFGSYQTFNFLDVFFKNDSLVEANGREIRLLKDAVSREMKSLGYRQSEDPDLWVNIGIVVEKKVQTRQTTFREAPIYIGQRNYHWESEEVVVDKYEEGTVTIDIIDAKAHQRIWEGVAAGTLTDNLQKLKKRINQAMALLFNRYPGSEVR